MQWKLNFLYYFFPLQPTSLWNVRIKAFWYTNDIISLLLLISKFLNCEEIYYCGNAARLIVTKWTWSRHCVECSLNELDPDIVLNGHQMNWIQTLCWMFNKWTGSRHCVECSTNELDPDIVLNVQQINLIQTLCWMFNKWTGSRHCVECSTN